MKKRTFLKALGASVPGMQLAAAPKMTNWAGNFVFSTEHILEPKTIADVQAAVKAEKKLRVLGTRHCFNRIADSEAALLQAPAMQEVFALDSAAKTVTVNGGMRYGRLAVLLDQKGFALHNLASLPHISVAGSCSTGTHGSGEKNGNLATAVSALEFVTASGETVRLTRQKDGETFRGAVVSLGALGVITKVTLDVQPSFAVRQYVYEDVPTAAALQNFDAIQGSAYSVSFFTDWQKKRINEIWLKARAGDKAFAGPKELFGGRLAKRNLHPIAEISAESCTDQLGVPGPWFERLPHFKMGFTPSAGKELQTEYFVPRAQAAETYLTIERLRDQITPLLMISEIRTIAADSLWLSPAYKRDSVAFHFTWKPLTPEVTKFLPVLEREILPLGARPHWGKIFAVSPANLRKSYERMDDFLRLAGKMDPAGKFRNAFLEKLGISGIKA